MIAKNKYTAKFKASVVLEALKENASIEEIANKYGVTDNEIVNWKIVFLKNSYKVFSNHNKRSRAQDQEGYNSNIKIAKLQQEILSLKEQRIIEPTEHPEGMQQKKKTKNIFSIPKKIRIYVYLLIAIILFFIIGLIFSEILVNKCNIKFYDDIAGEHITITSTITYKVMKNYPFNLKDTVFVFMKFKQLPLLVKATPFQCVIDDIEHDSKSINYTFRVVETITFNKTIIPDNMANNDGIISTPYTISQIIKLPPTVIAK